jgi:hypothetical protein
MYTRTPDARSPGVGVYVLHVIYEQLGQPDVGVHPPGAGAVFLNWGAMYLEYMSKLMSPFPASAHK